VKTTSANGNITNGIMDDCTVFIDLTSDVAYIGNITRDLLNYDTLSAWTDTTILPYMFTKIDSGVTAINATLGEGNYPGQIFTIVMSAVSEVSTVTVTKHDDVQGIPATGGTPTGDGEVGTFDAVDEAWILEWTGTEWTTLRATCTF